MTDPITRLNAALEGRYRVEREIGEGGMATVYLAHDVRHNRNVALKVLKAELAAVVDAERFLAEIETTAKLTHPQILPLHDSGEADGFLFFVTPYIEGDTLRDKIDREKQLSVDEALKITEDVAEALDHAHRHGVVHRDIKPANILLTDGRPLVADFGIALAVAQAGGGRVTETGLSIGTPHYMSPDQATGDRDVDPRTDVYALGSVLYEMLVGDPPYSGSTAQAVLAKILTDPAPAPTKVRLSIPPNVDAAIRKALEKLPADRFKTAQEFARALGDAGFRHGEEVGARVAEGASLWNPLSIGLGASTLVLALVLAWLVLRPPPPQPISLVALPLPTGISLPLGPGPHLSVSSDGSTVVFVGTSGEGTSRLWQRPLGQLTAVPIPGTEGGRLARFSPDSRSLVFAVEGRGVIQTMSLSGAPSETPLLEGWAQGPFSWGADGMIYFTNVDLGLSRVPAAGGDPEVVTTLGEGETGHYFQGV